MNEILKLKDKELLEKFGVLVREEKEATASVVAHLAEIDRRKLYALEGYSSLFSYCVEKFHYSESEAFLRIQAARVSKDFPDVLKLLEENKMTLTTMKLISPHLTKDNQEMIFKETHQKSTREVEKVLANLFPQEEEIMDSIRKLPSSAAEKTAQNLTRCATSTLVKKEAVKPIALKRFKVEFSASEELTKKIQRAKEILRHKYPKGNLEDIIDEALELLLEKKDPQRKISQKEQGAFLEMPLALSDTRRSRYVPEKIKQIIWERDEGQCSYVSPEGKSCRERNFIELDHVHPWSLGGSSTTENLRLLCRTHNQWRSEKTFNSQVAKKNGSLTWFGMTSLA
ncbi:MAG: HNH endonuclease [Deltaproteobacteria bacterium]|nr:HNH endonuclease [Deltaproteobacteria bacterium]